MHNRNAIALAGLALVAASALSAQNPSRSGQRGKSANYIYFEPSGTTCNGAVVGTEVKKVKIKADGYDAATMISPDSAKTIALCNVPGQLASGEIESNGTRSVYEISVLPKDKKTYSKIIIDASTGQVLSTKQFGGVRGYTGFLRESAERKKNKKG